jgi:hypothetical protein
MCNENIKIDNPHGIDYSEGFSFAKMIKRS